MTGAILLRDFQKIIWIFVAGVFFFANRIVRAASSGNSAQIALQAWHFLTCDEN